MIDLYCRWLYQAAHADGKPRMILLERLNVDSAPISLIIDRIKQVIIIKATRGLKNIRISGFFNGHRSRYFLHPNYLAQSFPIPRGHLFGVREWQNQREIADRNGKSESEIGNGQSYVADFTLSSCVEEKMDCGQRNLSEENLSD
jgi:hypothetical protein